MRKTLSATALCAIALCALTPNALTAVFAAPADVLAGVADPLPSAPAVDGEPAIAEPPPVCAEAGVAAATEPAPLFQADPIWACPWGAPRCSEHDHCDKYCGDPRFGWCFFDTGCCGCSG